MDGQVHPNLGLQSTIFTVLLLPCVSAPYLLHLMPIWPTVLCLALTVVYGWYGWRMQQERGHKSAKQLMFASFFYLPLVLIIFYLGNLLFTESWVQVYVFSDTLFDIKIKLVMRLN